MAFTFFFDGTMTLPFFQESPGMYKVQRRAIVTTSSPLKSNSIPPIFVWRRGCRPARLPMYVREYVPGMMTIHTWNLAYGPDDATWQIAEAYSYTGILCTIIIVHDIGRTCRLDFDDGVHRHKHPLDYLTIYFFTSIQSYEGSTVASFGCPSRRVGFSSISAESAMFGCSAWCFRH